MPEPKDRRQVAYGSGAWFRSRTEKELRDAVDGNMPGSRAHDGARAELDRRENERDRKRELRWIKLTFGATVILGLASVIATLVR